MWRKTLDFESFHRMPGGDLEICFSHCHVTIGLVSPVLVIDPSAKMLEIAKKREGVETMLATADGFLDSPMAPNYNKILMARCVHHFPDPLAVFKGIYKVIPKGGICMIFRNGLGDTTLPLFQAVQCKNNPRLSEAELVSLLEKAGFTASSEDILTQFTCSKDEWYYRIRCRFVSTLSPFTDAEIEKGIAELDSSTLKGKDTVECPMHMLAITGVK